MKKILTILLSVTIAFACVFSLSGCAGSEENTSATSSSEEESTEEQSSEEDEEYHKYFNFFSDSYSEDTYYIEKDEDKDLNGDGEQDCYKLSDNNGMVGPKDEYGVWWKVNYDSTEIDYSAAKLYSDGLELPNGKPGFYTFGKVPLLTATNKDKITIRTSSGETPTLKLCKLEVYGKHAIPITLEQREVYFNKYHTYVTDISEHYEKELKDGNFHDFSVTDSKGNLVEDFYNVPSGDYTVSWFEGTSKEEMTIPANSTAYQYANLSDLSGKIYDYTVENPYLNTDYNVAEFSLKDIPPGLYTTDRGGVFEIKK